MGLPSEIKEIAENFSDEELIKHNDRIFTYDNVYNQIKQVANGLLDIGIRNKEKFGIMLYNSPEYIEIMFGLQKVGAIPVPLNPKYGSLELEYINNDAKLDGIFIENDFLHLILNDSFNNFNYIFVLNAPTEKKFEKMINYDHFIQNRNKEEIEMVIDDNDIALIVYTGGTTDSPKGVMLTHSNLINAMYMPAEYVMNQIDEGKVSDEVFFPPEGMKFLIPTPICHLTGLMPVLTQISMHNMMIFPGHIFDPKELCSIIQKEKITAIVGVPTTYQILLDYINQAEKNWDLSSLTFITSGGSKMSKQLKIDLLKLFPEATLLDGYGSTETLGTSSIALMTYDDILNIKEGHVGQVVTGVDIKIINNSGEKVSVGEIGEVLFKSVTNMQGYLGDKTKTEATIDKNGWLHTGDLGRIDEEGNLFYFGRKKYLISSGAEKIYPEEVEEFLKTNPKIKEVAVFGVEDKTWGHVVGVLIELNKGETMDQTEIETYCDGKIASFKKPRVIKFTDKIPFTKNDKIDRAGIQKFFQP